MAENTLIAKKLKKINSEIKVVGNLRVSKKSTLKKISEIIFSILQKCII